MGGTIDELGPVEEWGEQVRHLEEGRAPVVFAFRPKSYVRMHKNRIREWEAVFKEELGLRSAGKISGVASPPQFRSPAKYSDPP